MKYKKGFNTLIVGLFLGISTAAFAAPPNNTWDGSTTTFNQPSYTLSSSLIYINTQVTVNVNVNSSLTLASSSNPASLILQNGSSLNFVITPGVSLKIIIPDKGLLSVQNGSTFEISGGDGTDASYLIIQNNNATYGKQYNTCYSSVPTSQYGCIVAPGGTIQVDNNSYLEYVGTTANQVNTYFPATSKIRNPSALLVDGPVQTNPAQFIMRGNAGIYFLSAYNGTDINTGVYTLPLATPLAADQGLYVLDIESPLVVTGKNSSGSSITSPGNTALNILSLEIAQTGGTVLSDSSSVSNPAVFPLRTFAKNGSAYRTYNKAAFLINNRFELHETNLKHDDQNHKVYAKNINSYSQPAYVGGEGCPVGTRNEIAYYNANLLVKTSAAFSDVDQAVPNSASANNSSFVFFSNGYSIDSGTGRNLILGTPVGAAAVNSLLPLVDDSGTSGNAHLNVIQETSQATKTNQQLSLTSAYNTSQTTQGIVTTGTPPQPSIQDLFLGQNSNVSIGGYPYYPAGITLTNLPQLFINGEYFSFDTQGGVEREPSESGTTGHGGIFVDQNGIFTINQTAGSSYRANMNTAITKSGTGFISIPQTQVRFGNKIGIGEWDLQLNGSGNVIVPLEVPGRIPTEYTNLSNYTLDWMAITKPSSYVPYDFSDYQLSVQRCSMSPVLTENIAALPIIQGEVGEFQIERSRLGDQAGITIDGGIVRELKLFPDCTPGVAPVALVVIQNDGLLGLGSRQADLTSIYAQQTLGVNGIEIVANGDSTIRLNSDIIIDNYCHFLVGPQFGSTGVNKLIITSDVPRELRVKGTGTINLSQFVGPNKQFVISGDVRLILEPGATIILGSGASSPAQYTQMVFTDQAEMYLEPAEYFDTQTGSNPTATDGVRARITGLGTITFAESSLCTIPRDALLGIETNSCSNSGGGYLTDITLVLNDSSRFLIGSSAYFGGGFQVGNTSDISGAQINFALFINNNSHFTIAAQGFFGISAGIVTKPESAPNTWTIGSLYNVNNCSFNFNTGIFSHNQVYTGDSPEAGLMALGQINGTYNFTMTSFDSLGIANFGIVLGGGNLYKMASSGIPSVNPIVRNTSTNQVSLLSARRIITNKNGYYINTSGNVDSFFDLLSTGNHSSTNSMANLGPAINDQQGILGYIFNNTIIRQPVSFIGSTVNNTPLSTSLLYGAVSIVLNQDGTLSTTTALSPLA